MNDVLTPIYNDLRTRYERNMDSFVQSLSKPAKKAAPRKSAAKKSAPKS